MEASADTAWFRKQRGRLQCLSTLGTSENLDTNLDKSMGPQIDEH